MDMEAVKKQTLIKLSLSYVLLQVFIACSSDYVMNLYDIALNLSVTDRFFYTIKMLAPTVVVAVALSLVGVFIFIKYLEPIWPIFALPRKKRNDVMYQTLQQRFMHFYALIMGYTIVAWLFGLIAVMVVGVSLGVFTFTPESPPWIVFLIKIGQVLPATLIVVFIIDIFFVKVKQSLEMWYFDTDKEDLFLRIKNLLIPFFCMFLLLSHYVVITWYYTNRNPYFEGPHNMLTSIGVISVLSFAFIAVVVIMSQRQDAMQTNFLKKQIKSLSSSQTAVLSERVDVVNFDKIGVLACDLNKYLLTLQTLMQVIKSETEHLKKNEAQRVQKLQNSDTSISDMSGLILEVEASMNEHEKSSEHVTRVTVQMNDSVKSLQGSIRSQTEKLNNSSSSIEEMLANITQAAVNVDEINNMCEKLLTAANIGRDKISESNGIIAKVAESSASLMEANAVISSIAAQTNLLAMNAAIEAAHAGDAGKGFAVVADEIRKLAQESSNQSKVIAGQLKDTKGFIENAVTSSEDAFGSFEEVLTLITKVTNMEAENTTAMQEQRRGSADVYKNLEEMKRGNSAVTLAAKTLTSEAGTLSDSVSILTEVVQKVKISVERMREIIAAVVNDFQEVKKIETVTADNLGKVLGEVDRFKV